MTVLVDTHCHLADHGFQGDIDAVMARAAEAGVATVIAVGAIGPIETDRRTVEIAEHHERVFAAVGVHPHDASQCDSARMTELAELARSKRVVAIGETGLDFHYMRSPREAQEMSFRRHLELAAKLDLPVVIHCRDAEARVAEIVREVGMPNGGGVIHCFTGDSGAAREFVAMGFYISFSGIVTFKNAGALRAAVSAVPDDRILVETDAPYLAPEPYRGKRNEPAYVVKTLEVIARTRGVDSGGLADQVFANAARLFRLR
jgi:TatD DNase family protein